MKTLAHMPEPRSGHRIWRWLLLGVLLSGVCCLPAWAAASLDVWRIGVVAGGDGNWLSLKESLEQRLPGQRVQVVAIAPKEAAKRMRDREIDFLVAYPCPSSPVLSDGELLEPVATAGVRIGEASVTQIGVAAVMLVPKNKNGIGSFENLQGKTIAIVSQDDYAWWMLCRELQDQGLAPDLAGFQAVEGGSREGVFAAVAKGQADAVVVNVVDLARLLRQGRLRLQDWNVVNRQPMLPGLEVPRSTPLHPGLTCFALPHVPAATARQLQQCLLTLSADSPVFNGTCMASWHLPPHLESLKSSTMASRQSGEESGGLGSFRRHPDALLGILLLMAVAIVLVLGFRRRFAEQRKLNDQHGATMDVYLDSAMNACGDGMLILDSRGRCLRANEVALSRLGWSLQEMQGVSFESLVRHSHPNGRRLTPAESPDQLACLHGIGSKDSHLVLWNKSGEPLSVSYEARRLKLQWNHAGALVVFKDISEQLRAQKEAEMELERYECEFEKDEQASLIIGQHGFCLQANAAAAALFGYDSAEAFPGHSLAEFSAFRQGEEGLPAVELLNGYYGQLDGQKVVISPWKFLRSDGVEFVGRLYLLLETPPGLDSVIHATIVPESDSARVDRRHGHDRRGGDRRSVDAVAASAGD